MKTTGVTALGTSRWRQAQPSGLAVSAAIAHVVILV